MSAVHLQTMSGLNLASKIGVRVRLGGLPLFPRSGKRRALGAAAGLLLLAGCADLTSRPEALNRTALPKIEMRLQAPVTSAPSGGYTRTLQPGSTWRAVGTIAEGKVYQPIGTILTAEAWNVHEAYIVVADGKWVGFWLPVEGGFVAATPPVAIDLNPEK